MLVYDGLLFGIELIRERLRGGDALLTLIR